MKKKDLLVVENEAIVALDIKSILKRLGYNVIGIVTSAHDCLELLTKKTPHLILMDIRLNGDIDGIETAAILQKSYDIPVIFITAYSDEATVNRIIPTGHYGYIVKPVNEKELHISIETSLYKHSIDKKIKESEMKFRLLFEQSRDANYLCDENKNFLDINRSMINLFGYNEAEFLKMNFHDLFVNRKDALELMAIIDKKRFVDNFETQLRKKDGAEISCLINSTILFDDMKRPSGLQGIIRDITREKEMAKERESILHDLGERVKELNCLYSLSEILEIPGVPFEEVLKDVADLLKDSWQYPHISCARIVIGDKEFRSDNFKKTEWTLRSDILINNRIEGKVEVCYLERMPNIYEGPFQKEERELINAAASRLGIFAERKIAEEELRRSQIEFKNLSNRLQTIREEERTRISREIHDELGQALTVLKMDMAWFDKNLDKSRMELKNKSESLLKFIDEIIQKVRKISSDLRPGILDDLGLCAAIEWEAGEIEKRTGIRCSFHYPEEISAGEEQSISVFRVFQEAMTNVIRHSKASKVNISLTVVKDNIELIVKDNGIGITDDQINYSNSCGIIGMRERVSSCGGVLEIDGKKDSGTTVKIKIPLNC